MTQSTNTEDEPRLIEAEAVPNRFARGWHCLGLVRDFADGKPHSVQAFGTKLVIFQGKDGELKALDAYCRHMGGDLSQGTVKDGNVACPFHDWRWSGEGRCVDIPYARRVPLRARTRAWHTLSQSGQFFVWHDPEGNPPDPALQPPVVEGYGEDSWTEWIWTSIEIDTNCREVIDNVVDMAHFFYIHYSMPTYFRNVFEGHTATQYMRGTTRDDMTPLGSTEQTGAFVSNSHEAAYFGPSYMIDKVVNEYEKATNRSVLINCHYPVTENKFILQYGVIVEKQGSVSPELAEATAKALTARLRTGFLQDVEIWVNKTRIDNPLLCEEDGPVYQLRRWYSQFYVDAADVTEDMTNRFEYEIDTSKALASWQAEVEENLRRNNGRPMQIADLTGS
ncbi:Rieske 2Fe-2S domain-containing protein [Streptosporangium sp. NPDC051022]|uniref:Rieske 2Fe-2S domain-containing protein n=1 Tax=Streptosporangium sp. NPDC051022 TaxID=3155752 RepID=UPI0034352090